MNETKTTCPHCGSTETAEILYGMPTEELVERMAAGEVDVALGGCCILLGESPSHHCRGCGQDFGVFKEA